MKKLLSIFCSLFVAYIAQSQVVNTQSYLKAKRLEAVDSFRLRGIWYKSFQFGGDSVYISSSRFTDTLFAANNTGTRLIGFIDRETALIDGGIVTHATGPNFDVSAATYYINSGRFNSLGQTVTLTAPDSLPRIDVIALDSLGNAIVITGTPSAAPVRPQVDTRSQLYLTFVLVGIDGSYNGGAIVEEKIYDEHIEWITSDSGTAVNFDATTLPYTGSIHINYNKISPAVDKAMYFRTGTDSIPLAIYNTLKFWVKIQKDNNSYFEVSIGNGSSNWSLPVILDNSKINNQDTNYQNISIPLNDFGGFTASSFNHLKIIDKGAAGKKSIDNILVQGGIYNWGTTAGLDTMAVVNVIQVNDTTLRFCRRSGYCFEVEITGTGGGGGATPDLQAVTDEGSETNNAITVKNTFPLSEYNQIKLFNTAGQSTIELKGLSNSAPETAYGTMKLDAPTGTLSIESGFDAGPGWKNLLFENAGLGQSYTLQLPDANGYLATSVNGVPANISGNIVLPDSSNKSDFVGNLFKEKNFTDLSKFDVNGATVSASGGKLDFSAGANNFTQTLDVKGFSCLENYTLTGRFIVGQKNASSFGFGLGIRTAGVYGLSAIFDMTTGANSGKITIGNNNTFATSSALAFNVGDTIVFSLEKSGADLLAQAYNKNTKAAPVRITYSYTIYSPNASTSWYGKYAVFSKGGLFSLDSLAVFSKDINKPDLLILGDSKVVGYQANNYTDGFAQQLRGKYKYTDIYAAPGLQINNALNLTGEIISLHPKNVLMALGSNDIRAGRTFAQYTSDYDTVVTRLQNAGITVYHTLPFYEKAVDVKPLVDYIASTYPANKVIDTYYPTLAAGALDADTLHPSILGHQYIYKAILNADIIPSKKTFELPLATGSVPYGSFDGGLSSNKDFNYLTSGLTGMLRLGSKVRIGTHNGNGIISLSGNNIDQSNGVTFSQVGNDVYIIRDGTLNIKTVAGGVTTSVNNVGAVQTGSTITANGGMVVPTMVGYFWGNTTSGYSIASWTGGSGHMDFRVKNVTAATIDSAGRFGIGVTTPEETAKLHIFSTTQGVLFPSLSQVQIDAIVNPAEGLIVHNKETRRLNWYDQSNSRWLYSPIVETGSGAPASTPVCVGDHYIDTTNKKEYVAVGTSSSSDWTILN